MLSSTTATAANGNTEVAAAQERVFLARNDTLDSDLSLQLIADLTAAETIGYAFSININPLDWDAAHAVGAARTAINKARGRTSATYRRGEEEDKRIDREGALAELAVFGVVGKAADSVAPLVEYKPNRRGADFEADGKGFDIKSVSQSKARCCVNRSAHFEKKPAAYVIVKIASELVLDVYVASHGAVEAWKMFKGYTPYFAADMPTVMPLPSVVVDEEPTA